MADDIKLKSLDEQIAIARANINELIEEATAFSGAGNDERTSDRIAEQEQHLASLTAQHDALVRA